MTFSNNAEFEIRIATVIGSDKTYIVVDPDLEICPEMYIEFSWLGCGICQGGAGAVTEVRIYTTEVDTEVCVCDDCRYALEYGVQTEDEDEYYESLGSHIDPEDTK